MEALGPAGAMPARCPAWPEKRRLKIRLGFRDVKNLAQVGQKGVIVGHGFSGTVGNFRH